ncbi:CocE/NonD family hydrolase [Saccharopolyspora rosea]|uniref:CocE/NonD family hydrolase n=1 Tax=Saccharopolyspora rosea TaxID=524884 RepID=A0ABW3G1S7_9PSEU|nr:CocE/NonD family hydrolase [Saccharopolyspora rosea]
MRLASLLAGVTALVTATSAVPAVAAPEPSTAHRVVRSFDGTPIYRTLFLPVGADAAHPAPLVLRSHGWGGHGERDLAEASTTTRALLDAGYAVLTWDERGFGYSGGEVQLLKPEFEGHDVSALLDDVATDPHIASELACQTPRGPGGRCADPVVGMTGGSYAGGIQPLAAAFDAEFSGTTPGRSRIDAIAPEITWNDLRDVLDGNGVINLGWSQLLYASGLVTAQADGLSPANPAGPQAGGLAEPLHRAELEGVIANRLSAESLRFLGDSSIASYGDRHPVEVPTLLMQGSVDTLFDVTEADRTFQRIRRHAPAKLVVFCGGHVSCPADYADAHDRSFLDGQILTWFARYLRGRHVDTGTPVAYRTNAGIWRTAEDFPPRDVEHRAGSGRGRLLGTPVPTTLVPTRPGPVSLPLITAQPNPPGDPHAFTGEVLRAGPGGAELVGVPAAELSVTGTGPEAHLFVKLVDRERGQVVNLQEAPLRVTGLSGTPQRFRIDMPGLAYTLPPGHHLDLQVATSSLMHAGARTPSTVDVAARVDVPVRPS